MDNYQIKSRVELLSKLHSIVINMNDERAYDEWIVTVPDEATEEDFKSIAQDNWFFEEVLIEFMKIFRRYRGAE